ncbi:MAG: alpha/beta fold hydrolase [Myxococcota bacterium]
MDDLARRRLAAVLALTGLLPAPACAPKYAGLPPIAPSELWAPLPVQHVTVDGIDIAYVDSGPVDGGGPPVVLIHGLSSWIGFWEYQLPALAKTHRVLALDLPGFGASGRPDAPYTPPWYADVVTGWMSALGIDAAVLVGHSMGGQIATTIALDHPDRVEALVLAAPAGIESFSPGAGALMKQYWTDRRTYDTPEEEIRYAFTGLAFARVDDGVERLLSERVRMRGTDALLGTSVAVARCVAGMVDFPVYDRLGGLTVPTLVVFGSDDRMIPNPLVTGGTTRAIARRAKQAIPGAELVVIEGAGHTVHHDAPEVFDPAVEAFLARIAK